MRAREITEATLDDYLALGIPAYYAKLSLELKTNPQTALLDYQRDQESARKRKEQEEREDQMVAQLDQLAKSKKPLTHDEASAVIANDDEIFDNLLGWLNGDPDRYEDHPEQATKLRQIIQRIKPFPHPPLYRGESTLRTRQDTRGFHSWTPNRQAVKIYYHDAGGAGHAKILMMTKPAKAVEHANIGHWRMRLRPDESHYLGSRSEWFVLDGQPAQVLKE